MSLWTRTGVKVVTGPKHVIVRRGWNAFRIARLLAAILTPEATIFELVSGFVMEATQTVCCNFGIPP